MHGCVCLFAWYCWIYVCDVKAEAHLFSLWLQERRAEERREEERKGKERRGMTPRPCWNLRLQQQWTVQSVSLWTRFSGKINNISDDEVRRLELKDRKRPECPILSLLNFLFHGFQQRPGASWNNIDLHLTQRRWHMRRSKTIQTLTAYQERTTKNQMVTVSTSLFHYSPLGRRDSKWIGSERDLSI